MSYAKNSNDMASLSPCQLKGIATTKQPVKASSQLSRGSYFRTVVTLTPEQKKKSNLRKA